MEALASDNLALPLKFSLFVKFVLLIIKKPEKIGVIKEVSSLFAILCFLPVSQIWYFLFG